MPELASILEAAENLLEFIKEHTHHRPDKITQSGGYLSIARDDRECPDLTAIIGELSTGRFEAYNDVVVMDGALRLNPSELSSKAIGSLAGGIRTPSGVRICISGFRGEWNVALALLLAKRVWLVNEEEFLDLAGHCRSKAALELADLVAIEG